MNNYPYRKGVNAFVIDNENHFLLVQKQNYGDNQWDVPGGGLEDNEKPKIGILRELNEELGSTDFEIVKESTLIDSFEWPEKEQEKAFAKHKKWWRGQEKYQFLIKFTGSKQSLVLQDEEIRKIVWVPYSKLKDHLIFEGQMENANKVLKDFGITS